MTTIENTTTTDFSAVTSVKAHLDERGIRELDGCESDEAVESVRAAVESALQDVFPEASVSAVCERDWGRGRDWVEVTFASDFEDDDGTLCATAQNAADRAMEDASRQAIEQADWQD